MEQKHARAAQNIVRTHPPFSKMTWRLRNCPGNTTSYRTDTNRDLTLHSSEQKTGSSELWNLMTSRIVCCLATLGSNKRPSKIMLTSAVHTRNIYTTLHINEAISLVLVRALLEYKPRMTSYNNKI